jgi:serine/threonine protein kinase
MPQTAQHLLGQLVDGRFPLRRLLGTTQNSAVFLTDLPNERPSEPAPEAAIKLIPEDPDTAEQQLERWKTAAALSHSGLLRILHFGRSTVDGSPCLFVVMELASENLAELLTQRALTPEETSGMMAPVLATLDFLHEKGLVHGGIKPSNILAKRDVVKLSPDRIVRAGESSASWPFAAPYAAPESLLFPASDLWSLGISLYETLTQYLPKADSNGHYVLPQLPSPFAEVIRGALVEDATERITLDQVRTALDPSYVAGRKPVMAAAVLAPTPEALVDTVTAPPAPKTESVSAKPPLAAAAHASAAGAAASRAAQAVSLSSVDPLSVPLSPISPNSERPKAPSHIPVSSLPNVNVTIAAPRRVPIGRASSGSLKYFLIGAAGTLVLAALIVPRMLRNAADTSSLPPVAVKSGSDNASPSAAAPAASGKTAAAPPKVSNANPTVSKSEPARETAARASTPAPASKPPAAPSRSIAPASSLTFTVVHQVVPEVSAKARSTIRGTVRINVRVQLSPDGSVSSAALDSPAISQFFANIALQAARDWRFAPSSNSSALLRFDFTNSGSNAYLVP